MDPIALTTLLRDGGPWALLALALMALAYIARSYVKARDARDELSDKIMKQLTDLTERAVEAFTLQKTSNYQVSQALQALDRRLENVERNQD